MNIIENWTEYVFKLPDADHEVTIAIQNGSQFLKIPQGSYYIRKLTDDEDMSKLVKGVSE